MGSAHRIRPFPILTLVAGVTAVLVWASPVLAQTPAAGAPAPQGRDAGGLGVVAPPPPAPPAPDFGFEPGIPPEQGRTREEDFYPERTRSIHQPAFLRGATQTVRTSRTSGVRWGLSGWTAPRVPFDFRESSGGVAFGLSVEWGTPLEPPAGEPTSPAQR